MEKKVQYYLYDGRYTADPDDANIYEICDTLEEARREAPEYGDDTVIVKTEFTEPQECIRRIISETIISLTP